MSESKNIYFLKGLLIGGLIGAAAGILFAPKSGRETREDISKKTQELYAKAKEEYDVAVDKSRKTYESAVERMKELQSAAMKKAAETEGKVEELAEKSKEAIGDARNRFKRAVDAGIEAYKEEKEKV